jgi:murein DD-endopeptidase MepM/ murein hydrolase activator NlpD
MENSVQAKNKISPPRKILSVIALLAVFISFFAPGQLHSVHAQSGRSGAALQISGHVLSDGQFVYGPNVGDFDLKVYLRDHAPNLYPYADDLYGRSEYFSINPRVYLTLLEVHGNLVSSPDLARIENPFDLPGLGFIAQIESISEVMSDAYYLHLYAYSPLPTSRRQLPSLMSQNGESVEAAPDTNAGTYAIMAVLSKIENQATVLRMMDNSQPDGFYQTYIRLFQSDDPLDETNHIDIPGASGALSRRTDSSPFALAGATGAVPAPDGLLQLPYLRGQSWFFGGVHSNGSGGVQSPFTDASALDFGPGNIAWGGDTSNMWVVASASGIPTKISNCYFSILHTGGWETTYYHLENIQNYSGSINQNDRIGVIANTLAEATCSGGSATGPHVHFNLKHNGALVAINGTPLSGWYVHAGRWNYDTDRNYMWLEKDGLRKYANVNTLLSEATPVTISGNGQVPGVTLTYTDGTPKFVTTDGSGNYSIPVPAGWSGTVTSYKSGYSFAPASRTYSSVLSNQTSQDYTAQVCPTCADADSTGVFRPGNGLLYLKNLNITGYADIAINYGLGGDYPVVGDWDGDGDATIGIYRNGSFYLRNDNSIGFADLVFPFGTPGDQPIAGDWDGDGVDTIGLYRNGTFLLRNSNSAGAPDASFALGNSGDVGIAGDWDGDGMDTTGVFRPSNGALYLKNKNETGFADIQINYGLPGDKPVTGDWNNDGVDTIGVYRNGIFMLRNSNTIGFADIVFALGMPGDMPIAGNWDALP